MKNILFVAAHPDDELVGATFIIKNLLQKKNIIIFFLTNGVISKEEMWFWNKKKYKEKKKIRDEEMKKSLKLLGIKKFFKQDIPTRKLKENIERTFEKINLLVKDHKIDTIFCPAYEGGHQDHDVSNFICSRLRNSTEVYEYAEYNFSKGRINCNKFVKSTKNEITIKLSEKEKKEKIKFLKIYNSEKGNLNYLHLNEECYRKIYNYDYTKAPHHGKLFYRRFSFFSWHPRVDSDTPEIVIKKIVNSEIF